MTAIYIMITSDDARIDLAFSVIQGHQSSQCADLEDNLLPPAEDPPNT